MIKFTRKKTYSFNNIQLNKKDIFHIFLMFISVILLFMFSMWGTFQSFNYVSDNINNNINQQTEDVTSKIESIFDKKIEFLNYIASLPEIYNMDWNTQYDYLLKNEKNMGFNHVFIVDTNGTGYYVNNKQKIDHSNEEFFKNLLSSTNSYITEPYKDLVENITTTTICIPIRNQQKLVGFLCGVINLDQLYNIIWNIQDNSNAVIVNNKGEYIIHNDMNNIWNKKKIYDDFSKEDEVKLIRNNISKNCLSIENIVYNNRDYYVAFSPIKMTNWTVIIQTQSDILDKSMKNIFKIQLFCIILLILLFIILFKLINKIFHFESMAFIDDLTGINNRSKLTLIMDKLKKTPPKNVMIVIFDLNNFKKINDTFGHSIGDEALIKFSNALKITFGEIGFIARVGGDEFISILANVSKEAYYKALYNLQQKINEYNSDNKQLFTLSMSYGMSEHTYSHCDNKPIHELYDEADQNMYKYKNFIKSFNKRE